MSKRLDQTIVFTGYERIYVTRGLAKGDTQKKGGKMSYICHGGLRIRTEISDIGRK